jgi:3-deoxy-D-arabino-heptulosonate 7-phosphate (DAHP) synthase
MMDVHPVPEEAAVDPLQALDYDAFGALSSQLQKIWSVLHP